MPARALTIGTAGHIDHGKTALVRALTGIQTDRLEQEQRRGISIDIGFAHVDLDAENRSNTDRDTPRRVGIVDVPGHERFIKNMLAGASGIDLAMLIVAADDSVMPQTREHLAILELLRVRHGIVVITKTDLVDTAWLDLVEQDVAELVDGTFLEGAPVVRVSSVTGVGLDRLRATLGESCSAIDTASVDEPFRIAVDRSFVVQGLGTVVTGTVWSGRVSVGDEVAWLPGGNRVRIRGMQSHGQTVEVVNRGQRAALNLSGVHHTHIGRGHELATPGYLRASNAITVELRVLAESPWPVRHRSRLRLHLGTGEAIASVRLLEGTTSIAPGARGLARLTSTTPMIARCGQPFVVRAESPLRTIGGGIVLQPVASRIARRDEAVRVHLRRLDDPSPGVRAGAAVRFLAWDQWDLLDICRDAGLDEDAATAAVAHLAATNEITTAVASRRMHRDVRDALHRRIVDTLAALHAAAPLEAAIPRQRLISRLAFIPEDLVTAMVDQLVAEGALVDDTVNSTGAVCLPEFRPTLSDAQTKLQQDVLAAYERAEYKPPDQAELARLLSVGESQLRPILDLCAAQATLVHVGGGMYLHGDLERRLRERVQRELDGSDGMTASELKTVIGTTRKYAMPMCEYLDRVGVTRRVGDVRVLVKRRSHEATERRRAE